MLLVQFVRRVKLNAMKKKLLPQDVPIYRLAQVARWVGVPAATMHHWAYGRNYHAGGRVKRSAALFTPADGERGLLSFDNIAEAHILDAARKARIAMVDVRAAIDVVLQDYPSASAHPLLTGHFYRHGKKLFVQSLRGKVATSRPIEGQVVLADLLDDYLERIQRDDQGRPIRLFPMRYNESQRVMLDFNVAGGQPVIAGTGILVEFIRDLKKAGTSIPDIARNYGLDEFTVAEAINYIAA
jgi:uncharacterized protein (DUF433 family)